MALTEPKEDGFHVQLQILFTPVLIIFSKSVSPDQKVNCKIYTIHILSTFLHDVLGEAPRKNQAHQTLMVGLWTDPHIGVPRPAKWKKKKVEHALLRELTKHDIR